MRLSALLVMFAACGGAAPAPAGAPAAAPASAAAAPAAAPRALPEYPGSMMGGVQGGPDPTELVISTDPLDTVRAFYTKEHLAGFEILGGDATQASPLHVRDAAAHRQYAIAVYEESGATMIAITTHLD